MARLDFTYFDSESASDDLLSPVWTFRVLPLIVLLALMLAETVATTGFWHGILIGLSIGQMIVLTVAGFQLRGVLTRTRHKGDVEPFRIS